MCDQKCWLCRHWLPVPPDNPRAAKLIEELDGCVLNVSREYSLDEVGEVLGVSRERIRQIEVRAIKRVRQHDEWKRLRGHL